MEVLAAMPVATADLNAIAAGPDGLLAVGDSGVMASSGDGRCWIERESGTDVALRAVCHGPEGFVAVGDGGTVVPVADWRALRTLHVGSANLTACAHGGGGYAVCGDAGAFYTSPDGLNWTPRSLPTNPSLRAVAYGAGRWVTGGQLEGALVSGDGGETWTPVSLGLEGGTLLSLSSGPGGFVAVVERLEQVGGLEEPWGFQWLVRSADGVLWIPVDRIGYGEEPQIVYAGGYHVVVHGAIPEEDGTGRWWLSQWFRWSADGVIWEEHGVMRDLQSGCDAVAGWRGQFIGVGRYGMGVVLGTPQDAGLSIGRRADGIAVRWPARGGILHSSDVVGVPMRTATGRWYPGLDGEHFELRDVESWRRGSFFIWRDDAVRWDGHGALLGSVTPSGRNYGQVERRYQPGAEGCTTRLAWNFEGTGAAAGKFAGVFMPVAPMLPGKTAADLDHLDGAAAPGRSVVHVGVELKYEGLEPLRLMVELKSTNGGKRALYFVLNGVSGWQQLFWDFREPEKYGDIGSFDVHDVQYFSLVVQKEPPGRPVNPDTGEIVVRRVWGLPSAAPREAPATVLLEGEHGWGGGRIMTRSRAAGSQTAWLKAGETRRLFLDVEVAGRYVFRVRYSNDNFGASETVGLTMDGQPLLEFVARDTGDGGAGWNVFEASPPGVAAFLGPGEYEVLLGVREGDGYGVEVDQVRLERVAP